MASMVSRLEVTVECCIEANMNHHLGSNQHVDEIAKYAGPFV